MKTETKRADKIRATNQHTKKRKHLLKKTFALPHLISFTIKKLLELHFIGLLLNLNDKIY
jgi:hypothetical protein